MSEDSPFKISVIVMPMGPEPKPDSFGITRDGKSVAWLSLKQIEEALAKWRDLEEKRRDALSKSTGEITIRNEWLLRLLKYPTVPGYAPCVSMHRTMWLRVLWWCLRNRLSRLGV